MSKISMSLAVLTALALTALSGRSAEVMQVTWQTDHAAQPARVQASASGYLPAFRIVIGSLPEASIVSLALSGPAILGLTVEQASRLRPLMTDRYRLMAESRCYAKALSALPYCFSAQRPTMGLASVYVPDKVAATTQVILFLHGYGGSFLWYQHYLSEIFPNDIIICPAFGIGAESIPQAYVTECLEAVSKRLGFQIGTPSLVGLSGGGFEACRLFIAAPHSYLQMICLGAYAPDNSVSRFTSDLTPRFLLGEREPFVASGEFQRRVDIIRRTCPKVEAITIPGADHFFLLTHPTETVNQLRRWLSTSTRIDKGAPK
jgi:pimeloyl-ACP methyl ester carboxylesterase